MERVSFLGVLSSGLSAIIFFGQSAIRSLSGITIGGYRMNKRFFLRYISFVVLIYSSDLDIAAIWINGGGRKQFDASRGPQPMCQTISLSDFILFPSQNYILCHSYPMYSPPWVMHFQTCVYVDYYDFWLSILLRILLSSLSHIPPIFITFRNTLFFLIYLYIKIGNCTSHSLTPFGCCLPISNHKIIFSFFLIFWFLIRRIFWSTKPIVQNLTECPRVGALHQRSLG